MAQIHISKDPPGQLPPVFDLFDLNRYSSSPNGDSRRIFQETYIEINVSNDILKMEGKSERVYLFDFGMLRS